MTRLVRATLNHPDTQLRIELIGDLAEQYLAAMERYRSRDCGHTETELREKTVSGGGIQCKPQCLICGVAIGNSRKKQDSLPAWDQAIQPAYAQARSDEDTAIRRKFVHLYEVETKRLEEKSKDWQAEYSAYRRTPVWQEKRARVLRRANGICEGCLDSSAVVVHHTTYAHMGDELLYQLVALCRSCHQKAHPEHHESFYDIDYVPCDQCRWGDGSITCGKFAIPAYEALEAGGSCGPDAGAFEGLK